MTSAEIISNERPTAISLQPKPCAHAACSYMAAANTDYCGSYCETAKEQHQEGDGCGCGHPGCTQH